MSKLNIDQKNILLLFSDRKSDFLIPDYQRPYAWELKECQTLWDDIFAFSFPNNDYSAFNKENDEYFLGPIVTFKNESNKLEIIDGQQRLTTLMLLLRAFYAKFGNMQDSQSDATRKKIEKCIWKVDEFDNPNKNKLKIDSEVASDDDKDEFLNILKTGIADKCKSRYAKNYIFFQEKIDEFLNKFPSYFPYLPTRILQNCILLPIEAESQDTALRIFSTLNDRGKPLSDADIFKAQFYKFYTNKGEKKNFISKWKELEEKCNKLFHPIYGTPMDELFTRYMYFERAKQGNKSSTTQALRKFYEQDSYALLKKDDTFNNLIDLARFWEDIDNQDSDRFSIEILKKLFVLNYAPNGMWTYIVSVYYLTFRDSDGNLDESKFDSFLDILTAFVWAYSIVNPGVNALRTPVFSEMVNIVNGKISGFKDFILDKQRVLNAINNYEFSNNRAITKSMITWWAFQNPNQKLISFDTTLEIEHIFAKHRQLNEKSLSDPHNLESLGNKSLLEKRINIRAADYRFADKKKYYKGYTNLRGDIKVETSIKELIDIASSLSDFKESNIIEREKKIIKNFISFLEKNNLLN